MKSRSTIRTEPTPARTRWFARTVPRAPQPQIVTFEAINFRWPASPSEWKRIWRL